MAFRARPTPTADADAIRPIAEHERYAAAIRISRIIDDKLVEIRRSIDRTLLEAELSRTGALGRAVTSPRTQMLQQRLETLRATQSAPAPQPSPAGDWPAPVVLALQIAAGEPPAKPQDRASELRAFREAEQILDAGSRAQTLVLDEIRADLSLVASQQLAEQHRAVLRTVFEAAVALSAAVEAERALIASLILRGFDPRLDVLRRPGLDAAGRLGTLDQVDSQLSWFRRRLEDWGVL